MAPALLAGQTGLWSFLLYEIQGGEWPCGIPGGPPPPGGDASEPGQAESGYGSVTDGGHDLG